MRDQTSKYLIYGLVALIVVLIVLGIIYYPRKEVVVVTTGQNQHSESFQPPQQPQQQAPPQAKPALVLFHSKACSHCHAMMPEWEKLKTSPIASQISIMDYEYGTNPNEANKYSVTGFPSIKFFPAGYGNQPVIDYRGDRTANAIINFLVNGPPQPPK